MKKLLLSLFILASCGFVKAEDYTMGKATIIVDEDEPKPALRVNFRDLAYKTTFYRISDAATEGGTILASAAYCKFSPLNSDGTRLLLQRDHNWNQLMLYNAITSTFIELLPPASPSVTITVDGVAGKNFPMMEAQDPRWSKTEPNIIYLWGNLYGAYSMRLMKYDITTNEATTVHDFAVNYPNGDTILNGAEGDFTTDGRYCAFMVQRIDDDIYRTIAIGCYDKQTDTIVGDMEYADYIAAGGQYGNATYSSFPSPNMVDMSPSGSKVMVLWLRCWGTEEYGTRPLEIGTIFDGGFAFDKNMSAASGVKVAIDAVHTGWAYDADSTEYVISQNNRTDWIEIRNPVTGETKELLFNGDFGWNNGMHFARMPLLPSTTGWAVVSIYRGSGENPTGWGDDNIIMVELVDRTIRPPLIRRLCNDHNANGNFTNPDYNYRAEGIATISQFGDKLWFNSQWIADGIDAPVECFEMPLPGGSSSGGDDDDDDVYATNYTKDSEVLFTLLMDADTNPLTDTSPNALNATKKAAAEPTFNPADIPMTYSGGCQIFDGVDDYVYVSSEIALGERDFSVVMWVKPDAVAHRSRLIYLDDEFSILYSTGITAGGAAGEDTLGNTGTPSLYGNRSGGWNDAEIFALTEDATVTKMSIYLDVNGGSNDVKACIWNNDGAGGIPGTLVAASAAVTVTDPGWYEFTFSEALTAGSYAFGCICGDGVLGVQMFRSDSVGHTRYWGSGNNYTTPTTFDTDTPIEDSIVANSALAVYATYETGAGTDIPAMTYITVEGTAGSLQYRTGTDLIAPWQHIAFTWDDSEAAAIYYVNGIAKTLTATTGWTVTGLDDDKIYIGAQSTEYNFTDCTMDEVAVFKRVLTPTEILEIIASGLKGNAPVSGGGGIGSNIILSE